MRYIKFLLHTDYSGAVLTDPVQHKEFKKGTLAYLDPYNQMICIDAIPICHMGSQVSQDYFCRDDDNQGWLRHAYTYAIAYANRQRIHSDGIVSRFTEQEIETIITRWNHFLAQDCPGVIIFNINFFNATIEDLQQMAKEINIKIKLDKDISDKNSSDNNSSNKDDSIKNDSDKDDSIKNSFNKDDSDKNDSIKNDVIDNKITITKDNNIANEVKIINNVIIKK